MKCRPLLIFVIFLVQYYCCSGLLQNSPNHQKPPEWFLNIPRSEDTLYEIGEAIAKNRSIAAAKAEQRARSQLEMMIKVKIQRLCIYFGVPYEIIEEVEVVKYLRYEPPTQKIHICKNAFIIENGMYHVYVLCGISIDDLTDIAKDKFEAVRVRERYKTDERIINFEEFEKLFNEYFDSDS